MFIFLCTLEVARLDFSIVMCDRGPLTMCDRGPLTMCDSYIMPSRTNKCHCGIAISIWFCICGLHTDLVQYNDFI